MRGGGCAGTREPPFIEVLVEPLRKEQEKAHIARGGPVPSVMTRVSSQEQLVVCCLEPCNWLTSAFLHSKFVLSVFIFLVIGV